MKRPSLFAEMTLRPQALQCALRCNHEAMVWRIVPGCKGERLLEDPACAFPIALLGSARRADHQRGIQAGMGFRLGELRTIAFFHHVEQALDFVERPVLDEKMGQHEMHEIVVAVVRWVVRRQEAGILPEEAFGWAVVLT